MKLLLDFFPIILFFVAFKIWGIYTATAVAIVATVGQIAWLRWRVGKVEPVQWVSLGVIVLFGGATLIANNETFIKWKPTVLYGLMGGALVVGELFFGRNLIRSMLGKQMSLPREVWTVLSRSWLAFFAIMAGLNLWVAYSFDTATWVNFKLFGGIGLMVVFVLAQGAYLSRHIQEPPAGATTPAPGGPEATASQAPPGSKSDT